MMKRFREGGRLKAQSLPSDEMNEKQYDQVLSAAGFPDEELKEMSIEEKKISHDAVMNSDADLKNQASKTKDEDVEIKDDSTSVSLNEGKTRSRRSHHRPKTQLSLHSSKGQQEGSLAAEQPVASNDSSFENKEEEEITTKSSHAESEETQPPIKKTGDSLADSKEGNEEPAMNSYSDVEADETQPPAKTTRGKRKSTRNSSASRLKKSQKCTEAPGKEEETQCQTNTVLAANTQRSSVWQQFPPVTSEQVIPESDDSSSQQSKEGNTSPSFSNNNHVPVWPPRFSPALIKDPSVYTQVIKLMFDIYIQRLRSAKLRNKGKEEWGQPIHCGSHVRNLLRKDPRSDDGADNIDLESRQTRYSTRGLFRNARSRNAEVEVRSDRDGRKDLAMKAQSSKTSKIMMEGIMSGDEVQEAAEATTTSEDFTTAFELTECDTVKDVTTEEDDPEFDPFPTQSNKGGSNVRRKRLNEKNTMKASSVKGPKNGKGVILSKQDDYESPDEGFISHSTKRNKITSYVDKDEMDVMDRPKYKHTTPHIKEGESDWLSTGGNGIKTDRKVKVGHDQFEDIVLPTRAKREKAGILKGHSERDSNDKKAADIQDPFSLLDDDESSKEDKIEDHLPEGRESTLNHRLMQGEKESSVLKRKLCKTMKTTLGRKKKGPSQQKQRHLNKSIFVEDDDNDDEDDDDGGGGVSGEQSTKNSQSPVLLTDKFEQLDGGKSPWLTKENTPKTHPPLTNVDDKTISLKEDINTTHASIPQKRNSRKKRGVNLHKSGFDSLSTEIVNLPDSTRFPSDEVCQETEMSIDSTSDISGKLSQISKSPSFGRRLRRKGKSNREHVNFLVDVSSSPENTLNPEDLREGIPDSQSSGFLIDAKGDLYCTQLDRDVHEQRLSNAGDKSVQALDSGTKGSLLKMVKVNGDRQRKSRALRKGDPDCVVTDSSLPMHKASVKKGRKQSKLNFAVINKASAVNQPDISVESTDDEDENPGLSIDLTSEDDMLEANEISESSKSPFHNSTSSLPSERNTYTQKRMEQKVLEEDNKDVMESRGGVSEEISSMSEVTEERRRSSLVKKRESRFRKSDAEPEDVSQTQPEEADLHVRPEVNSDSNEIPSSETGTCPICRNEFPTKDLEIHASSCSDYFVEQENRALCMICQEKFPIEQLKRHQMYCAESHGGRETRKRRKAKADISKASGSSLKRSKRNREEIEESPVSSGDDFGELYVEHEVGKR